MPKLTTAGPLTSKLSLSADPASTIQSAFAAADPSDIWSLSANAQVRSEILLLYPQAVMTPPANSGSLTGPQENGSASTTAAQGATGDAKIDGILSGVKWAGTFITYADTDSSADYQSGYFSDADGDGTSAQNEGFSQFTAQQTLALHTALNQAVYTQLAGAAGLSIEAFTNLGIDYNGSGSATATIRAANSSDPGTAYAYYPNNGIYGGDTFFGNAYDSTIYTLKNPVAGNYAWHTMLHELGHSLGLKHGQEVSGPGATALPTAWDTIEFSVMTYRSYVGAPLSGYSYEQWGAPQTYMMLDILALQTMYGADYSVNSDNTTYTWSPTTGETYIDGALAIDPGGNRIFATFWDGGGTDTYDLSNYTTNLSLDLTPGGSSTFSSTQLAYLGGGNYARGNVFNALLFGGNTASMIENATGGSGNDTILGNSANNVLIGNAGNDTISGGDGGDTLDGGAGDDILDGGSGADTVYGGTGNDTIYGGFFADAVYGEAGNDVFIMRQNSIGTEYGDNTDGGTGIDRLDLSQITTTYGSTVNLATGTWQYNPLYGGPWTITAVENVDGTQLDDTITGDGFANVLNGNAGDDWINGGGANDTIEGGNGNDLLLGGDGNDRLGGGSGNDQLRGGAGNDIFDGGSGQDLFYGEDGNDTLKIVNGWNGGYGEVFIGGTGIDTFDLSGTNGLNANVNLTDGQFEDIVFPGYGIALSSIENVIAGSGNDILTGSAEVNRLEGLAGNDQLFGLVGNDFLLGGDGNDSLDGGEGRDTMTGGDGDDTYYVDNVADVVNETSATGGTADALYSSVSYSLAGRWIEMMTLTGTSNIDGTGNSAAQTINGNSGNNTLNGLDGDDILNGGDGNDTLVGGGGADVMTGGLGDDLYYVDDAGDVVVEGASGGTNDRVLSSVTFSLAGLYVETLSLTGTGNVNGLGNSLANNLTGNSGVNLLSGGNGNDLLNGGLGADTLTGGANNDTFRFNTALGAGNIDTITDYVIADDKIELENAIFLGLPVGVLTSNAFTIGSAANDVDDRIIYNSATGALLFDADGTGAGGAFQFATISAGLPMVASEFVII